MIHMLTNCANKVSKQFCAYLSVLSVMHHIRVVTSDDRFSLTQSSCVLLQVLVASPYHANKVQLKHTHTHIHPFLPHNAMQVRP